MKTAASAGRIKTLENYNTQTPSSNCSESSAEISFSGHSLSGNQGSSTFSQNSATKNSQILGYQTSFEGNKTSNTPFLISSQSHSLTSPNSTHIPETIQSCHLSENYFAQTFYDQKNLSQFNQHQQTHMPLILPRLQNDLFPCLNLRPDNIYTQQGKTLLTTPIIPPIPSNSLLSPQTGDWSSSSSRYQYELIFLPANLSKCYGCSQSFAEKYRHPPYNIVAKHKDRRIRGVGTNGNIRYSSNFQNTYYHLNNEHILKKNPSFDRKIFIRFLRPTYRKSM